MKTKGRLRRIMSALLIGALITTMVQGPDFLTFATSREMKMDIGVDGDNVTAVLTDDGHMIISGHGETLDYTEETVPFADYVGKIRTLEIKAGVTSIGDYLLYNCGNLTGELELPGTLVRIGDYAFSGDSKEEAPKFDRIVNKFTKAGVVSPLDQEEKENGPGEGGAETTEGLENQGDGETLNGGETTGSSAEETSGDEEVSAAGQENQENPENTENPETPGSGQGGQNDSQGGSQTNDNVADNVTEESGEQNGEQSQTENTAGGNQTNGAAGENQNSGTSEESQSDESAGESQSNESAGVPQNVGIDGNSQSSETAGESQNRGNTDTAAGNGNQNSGSTDGNQNAGTAGGNQAAGGTGESQNGGSGVEVQTIASLNRELQQVVDETELASRLFSGKTMVRLEARSHVWVTSSLTDGADSSGKNQNGSSDGSTSESGSGNTGDSTAGTPDDSSGESKSDDQNNTSGESKTDNISGTPEESKPNSTNGTSAESKPDNSNETASESKQDQTDGTEESKSDNTAENQESSASISESTSGTNDESFMESSSSETGTDDTASIESAGESDGESTAGEGAGGLGGEGTAIGKTPGPGEGLEGALSPEEQNQYLVETVTEQEIGVEIFYAGQYGIYQCEDENITFIEAAEAAGYRRMDRMIKVKLDEITTSLPIAEGAIIAPECPAELANARNHDNDSSLFTQTFTGWTLKEEKQNLGADAPVYVPGKPIIIEAYENEDFITLSSNWAETCSVIPTVQADFMDTQAVYTAMDETTGERIPEDAKGRVTYQWQILQNAEDIASPSDAEEVYDIASPSEAGEAVWTDMEGVAWMDIEGATGIDYERIPLKADESSYFRVCMMVQGSEKEGTTSQLEPLYAEGIPGLYTEQPVTVHYEPGEGAEGTAPEETKLISGGVFTPAANPFTRRDGLRFGGWKLTYAGVSGASAEGEMISEGAILTPDSAAITLTATGTEPEPEVILTAQWKQAEVLYVNQVTGSDENPGTMDQPLQSLEAAYRFLPETEGPNDNVIELLADYNLADSSLENGQLRRNAVIRGKEGAGIKLATSQPKLFLAGDLTLEQIHLSMSAPDASISCLGSNLILGEGVVFQAGEGQELSLVLGVDGESPISYGTRGTSGDNPATAVIDSSKVSLTRVIGTGKQGAGDSSHPYSHLVMNGGSVRQIVAGSVFHSGTSYTEADIEIHGGTVEEVIGGTLPYGGSGILKGNVDIRVTGGDIGRLYGASAGEINSSFCETEGDIRLTITGGRIDQVYASGMTGKVRGNVDVSVSGGTIGSFHGGGVGASDQDVVYGTQSGTVEGNIQIAITGGRIGQGFYAGGIGTDASAGSGRTEGSITTTIGKNAVINGDVHGGGLGVKVEEEKQGEEKQEEGRQEEKHQHEKADTANGRVSGDTILIIQGGSIAGNVYGGGRGADTGGTSAVCLYGGSIGGSVYGGADGSGQVGSSEVIVHTAIGTSDQRIHVYGGGTIGTSVLGESRLTVGSGAVIHGDIYGGGQGPVGSAVLQIQGGRVDGDAYGGGDRTDTEGNVSVTQSGGIITGAVYGGGNQASVGGTVEVYQTAGTVDGSIYGGCHTSGAVKGRIRMEIGGSSANVFGGGAGSQTSAEDGVQIQIQQGAKIKNDVYGGGEDKSTVTGGTSIRIFGNVFGGSVFGGGKNSDVNGPVEVQVMEGGGAPAVFGGSLHSGTVNSPVITIAGVVTNVYGGGYGAGTSTASPAVTVSPTGRVSGQITGGAIQGTVQGGVSITLAEGSAAGSIYGGGQEADVSGSVTITTSQNSKAGNIYGGSNSSGVVSSPVMTIRGETGDIFGGGKGVHTRVTAPTITIEEGARSKDVYGGGENGNTVGTNTVILKGGTADRVFGGGLSSSSESAVVTLEVGASAGYLYGGARESGAVIGSSMVTVNGTCANIHGGGLGRETSVGSASVTVGGRKDSTQRTIHGGGDSGSVAGTATVIVSGPVTAHIYGGGKGSDSQVGGHTSVTLMKEITGSVYGGGNMGSVSGNANITVLSGASINGTIYGGGLRAGIDKTAKIEVQKDAVVTGDIYGGSCDSGEMKQGSSIEVQGEVHNIYGGGSGIRTIVTGDAHIRLSGRATGDLYGGGNQGIVAGNTRLEIADGLVAGSIYGGGQSGNVTGERSIQITGDAMTGGNALQSIGNTDQLILDHCEIEVTGISQTEDASDETGDGYALSRIGSLVLQNASALKLQAPVKLVNQMESRNGDGSLVSVTTDNMEEQQESKVLSTENAIYLKPGISMELRTGSVGSGTDYGPVLGYTLLGGYGETAASASDDNIYVLGAWNDGSQGGFLYADDIYDNQHQKLLYEKGAVIVPYEKKDMWNSWSIDADRQQQSATLTMSDRPGTGKTAQIVADAAKEEAVYRLIPDSIQLISTDGSPFTLVPPDQLDREESSNQVLALTLSTGSGITEGMEDLAYITGDTSTGTGEFIPASASSSGVIETRSLGGQSGLCFQVTLDNKNGVTITDEEETYPLQVTFDMAVYRPLSDGSRIRTGQMSMALQIRREEIRQYSDCLVSPGKQYRNARNLYDMEAEGGAAGVSISRGSSVTLQYTSASGNGGEGAVITDHQLSFSTYGGITEEGTLWSPEILPAGITILAVDRSGEKPVYYHYTTDGTESSIPMSSFIRNGTSQPYSCRIPEGTAENMLFILDFAARNHYSADRLRVGLSPVYEDGTQGSPGQLVFNVGGDHHTYGLAAASGNSGNVRTYMEDDTITIPVMTVVTGGSGTDTVGEGRQMAVRIRLKNRDTDAYVKIPSTWVAGNSGGDYVARTNGVLTVPLSSSLTALSCQLNLKLDRSDLPAGAYQLEMRLAQGVMAQYAAEVDQVLITHDFNLEKYRYSVHAVLSGDASRRVIPAEGERPPLTFRMEYDTTGNPDTSRVTLVTRLEQKNGGSFQEVDLDTLFQHVDGPRDSYRWGTETIRYPFKKGGLETGTYRLRFTVVDGSGSVVNESAENFVVLPQ